MMMKSLLVSNLSRLTTTISSKKGLSLLRGVSALAVMISYRPCSCFIIAQGHGRNSRVFCSSILSPLGFLHQVRGGGGASHHHDERNCPQQSSWQFRLSSSSTDGDKKMDRDALTRLQRETSTGSSSSSSTDDAAAVIPKEFETASEHVEHQKEVFDEMSPWFADHGIQIPENLIPVYQHLASKVISNLVVAGRQEGEDEDEEESKIFRVLDVATGTGVLFPFLLQAANKKGISLHITAIDLAPRMIDLAREHVDEVLQEYSGQGQEHAIDLIQANILDYPMPTTVADGDDGDEKEDTTSPPPLFDGIIINACFGNFFDPLAVLQHLTTGTASNGSLFVTHPLGSAFVQQLHDSDPSTVPHLLPSSVQEWQTDFMLKGQVPLTVQEFYDDISLPGEESTTPCYYSHLRRVRYTLLPQVMRFRGQVDAGYGRGGKKLGFPTANLPSRLFQDALSDVATGVYFGWALLEGDTKGRNVRHKAVVNVGYSPTFEGKENAEKIIEAHLMLDDASVLDPPDFYNETMRLELVAFLRPEIKFPSFPALIAQITADVKDSKRALAQDEPFATQWPVDSDSDSFHTVDTTSGPWIGASGGDDAASWEFDDMRPYLEKQKTSPP